MGSCLGTLKRFLLCGSSAKTSPVKSSSRTSLIHHESNENIPTLKIIIAGPVMSGKTVFMNTLTENDRQIEYSPTIGVEFGTKHINVNNKVYKLQFWDTSGDDRMKPLVQSYYRGSQIVFIVYRPTDDDLERINPDIQAKIDEIEVLANTKLIYLIRNSPRCDKVKQLDPITVCSEKIDHYMLNVDSLEHTDLFLETIFSSKKFIEYETIEYIGKGTNMFYKATAKKPAVYIYGSLGRDVIIKLNTVHQITT